MTTTTDLTLYRVQMYGEQIHWHQYGYTDLLDSEVAFRSAEGARRAAEAWMASIAWEGYGPDGKGWLTYRVSKGQKDGTEREVRVADAVVTHGDDVQVCEHTGSILLTVTFEYREREVRQVTKTVEVDGEEFTREDTETGDWSDWAPLTHVGSVREKVGNWGHYETVKKELPSEWRLQLYIAEEVFRIRD